MNSEKVQTTFFFIILSLALILVGFLFYPFLGALSLALILGIIFKPMYTKVLASVKNRSGLASLITIGFIFCFVIVPISVLLTLTLDEIRASYATYIGTPSQTNQTLINLSNSVDAFRLRYLPWLNINFEMVKGQITDWLLSNASNLFSSIIKIIFSGFVMIITLFYLFKDGNRFRDKIRSILPMPDDFETKIMDKVSATVNAVVRGSLFVALLQGTMTGIGLALFGIPQPILWGMVAAVAALVPTLGTSLVAIPSIIYLLLINDYPMAIGLTIWSLTFVNVIDNMIGPIVMGRGTKIHPLLVFLSVLGGLGFFGPLGFILGPVVLSVCLTLLEIYSTPKSNS